MLLPFPSLRKLIISLIIHKRGIYFRSAPIYFLHVFAPIALHSIQMGSEESIYCCLNCATEECARFRDK